MVLSFDYFLSNVDGYFDYRYLCVPGSCLVHTEAGKNVSGPLGLSHRQLRTVRWVLGVKSGSSVKEYS